MKIRHLMTIGVLLLIFGMDCDAQPQPAWPEITRETKPWTRWWWMGSAVNKQDLSHELEKFKKANLGGVEITPIYGVAGYEEQFIDYLSPQWMEMLKFTLQKSDSLGLGVDMATGTGWPFGGPWIHPENASKNVRHKVYKVNGGQRVEKKIVYIQKPMLHVIGNTIGRSIDAPVTLREIEQPIAANDRLQALALSQLRFKKPLPLNILMAYSEDGKTLNLTEKVDRNGSLHWTAPAGQWTLYAVFQGWHGKMVERAAPGGEGWVIDHFSGQAVTDYLDHFDQKFSGHDLSGLRAFFNDSYEVDDASGEAAWTPHLFREFEQRRGYNLRNHLPGLFGDASDEMNRRVLSDFRQTIADLLLEKFTHQWNRWAGGHQAIVRNQAHGSPANILDLYAASDIPETEGTDIMRAKMASSAAHVTGKPLVSSEAATWLDEHFRASLSEVKKAVDRFFLSGVNHIFYHGTAYSPEKEDWPGWLFYAAVHFQPTNPFWDHFGAFNQYVARVQSFLQSGTPDNDVLLYYPIHDQWAEQSGGLLQHFDGGIEEQFEGTAFKEAALGMQEQGYTFDFISDRQLIRAQSADGNIDTEGAAYETLVIPAVEYLPLKTLRQVLELVRSGRTVIMYGGKPQDVPGFGQLEKRQNAFKKLMDQLKFRNEQVIRTARLGEGKILLGDNLRQLLGRAGIQREPMVDSSLHFIRRSHEDGKIYFITNWGDEAVDGWVSVAASAQSAALYNPMHKKSGYAKVKTDASGTTRVYLQLDPGESFILKTDASTAHKSTYPYVEQAGQAITLDGSWSVQFVEGGPEIPADIQTDTLKSWTEFGDEAYKNFSGTARYTLTFSKPDGTVAGWLLDLGAVHESATISVNGQPLGTVLGPAYQVFVPESILRKENTLTIEVANSMANRIAYLDRQKVFWKKFYNVNFPARLGENRNKQGLFDASDWAPKPSGLLGPVSLQPVKEE